MCARPRWLWRQEAGSGTCRNEVRGVHCVGQRLWSGCPPDGLADIVCSSLASMPMVVSSALLWWLQSDGPAGAKGAKGAAAAAKKQQPAAAAAAGGSGKLKVWD